MRIRLNAQDRLVGYFDMLPYNPMPPVVTWNNRSLANDNDNQVEAVAFHADIANSKGTKSMFLLLHDNYISCDVVRR